jgi:putative DNA primase/helicase
MASIPGENSSFSLREAPDFWRYKKGVNVIPADTKLKTTTIQWKQYQESPIPESLHNQWKNECAFDKGIAIILGRVWHNRQNEGLYLNAIDCDNAIAIEEICSRNGEHISVERLAHWTLVEQHSDDTTKMHVLIYSHKPFMKKSSMGITNGVSINEIPAIEVKSLGSILFCSPSIHKNGKPYRIVGTDEPVICDDYESLIDAICRKYGMSYLEDTIANGSGNRLSMEDLFDDDYKVAEGNNRHEALLRVMESLIIRNSPLLLPDTIQELARKWNSVHCLPPLDDKEFSKLWKCACKFVSRKASKEYRETERKERDNVIRKATEAILSQHKFLTVEESKETLYYDHGVYVPGGEVLIEKAAEKMFGFKLANRHLAEIKGHIMRVTYHKQAELDSDINIINLKNGLFYIETGEIKEHSPDYLSITQMPVIYDPAVKPQLFGKYLQQVLYPAEIRTAVELMAYTLYRDNPYEILVRLFGYGGNGKSVFTGLLTSLHGAKNVSNVSLSSILKDRFALSDLENKCVNIDTELSSTILRDTAVLKKLTGRQPVRIERKHQRAYDAILHAKLIFSANKIPDTEDESDAFFRRDIILSFPNRFEDGRGADPNLLKKMTTEQEISGIFNVLILALKRLLKNSCIFVTEKTIEERREKHELAVDPVRYFLRDAVAEDSVESDTTTKDSMYQAYKYFCNVRNLAVESKENLGKILKAKYRYQDGRESAGARKTIWKGVKLAAKYNLEENQQTLI